MNIHLIGSHISLLRDKLDSYQKSFDNLESKNLSYKLSLVINYGLIAVSILIKVFFISLIIYISTDNFIELLVNEKIVSTQIEIESTKQAIKYIAIPIISIFSFLFLFITISLVNSISKIRILIKQRKLMEEIVSYFNDTIAETIDLAKIVNNDFEEEEFSAVKNRDRKKVIFKTLQVLSFFPPIIGQLISFGGSYYFIKNSEFNSRVKTMRITSILSFITWVIILNQ